MADNKDDKPGREYAPINDSGELLKSLFRDELDAIVAENKEETAAKTGDKSGAPKRPNLPARGKSAGIKKARPEMGTEDRKIAKSYPVSEVQASTPRKVPSKPVPSPQEPTTVQAHPEPSASTEQPVIARQLPEPVASTQKDVVPVQPAEPAPTAQEFPASKTPPEPVGPTQEPLMAKEPGEPSAPEAQPDVARVASHSVEQTPEKTAPRKEIVFPAERDKSYPYSVYLGSYKSRERAERAISEYRIKGLSPYWVKIDLGDKGTWYRVFSGYFQEREQANEFIKEKQITDSESRHTKYANLIGLFAFQEEIEEEKLRLSKLGYSPYVIPDRNGESLLYVGAFYQKARAQRQHEELASKGVHSQVVER